MVEAFRLGVSIAALRNRNRDGAPAIQCRGAVRRMHHTARALVSNLGHKKHINTATKGTKYGLLWLLNFVVFCG
jgi:hypothetical protein